MSADNWGYCPRCEKDREAEWMAAKKEADAAYGKVSRSEWESLCKRAKTLEASFEHSESTLREDYEIGVTAGSVFSVVYSGHCETCGFTHRFSHSEKV